MLELLEGDFGCGRRVIEVQAVGIVVLLVGRVGELFFLVVDDISSFGVDTVIVLAYHLGLCLLVLAWSGYRSSSSRDVYNSSRG